MENLTGKQFGIYVLGEALGEGGMATVYKAYQPTMKRYVAIKVLPRQMARSAEFSTRFKREARLLAQLQHPNILPIFDYGESDGYTYIVMPLMQSGTLADLLETRRLTLPEIQRILTQLADALGYAHTCGMIYRDVKPSNVLIDERGNCLLMDFGLARMTEATSRLTSSGAIMGTPAYMSPEQGSGPNVDGRSDLYSLGVMLYEMVTGKMPYTAPTPFAVIFKHILDPLPSPREVVPDLSHELEMVMLKSLAKKPADRYQTADEFIKALTDAISGRPADEPAAHRPPAADPTAISMPPPPVRLRNPASAAVVVSAPPPRPTVYNPPAAPPRPAPKRNGLRWALVGIGIIGACIVGVVLVVALYAYFYIPSVNLDLPFSFNLQDRPVATLTPVDTPKAAAKTPTSAPTATQAATDAPTVAPLANLPTVTVPADTDFVRINAITLNAQGQYAVDYETFHFTADMADMHIHFFFNTVSTEEAGSPGNGPWKMLGGPGPFTDYGPGNRPENASQLCALVADVSHHVTPNSGNCLPLPDVATVTARADTACLKTPTETGETLVTFKARATSLLKGFSSDKSWLFIQNPVALDATTCWIPFDSGVLGGKTENLPIVTP